MNRSLGVAAATAAVALAFPALASAHGSVYTSLSATGETRYAVTNHGFTYVLRESNGLGASKGMVGYNLIPTAWRTGKTFAEIMTTGGTGAQPHATCVGAAALESEAAIKSWQDADPFYNYVPFQAESANLEDTPARWLATLAAAGVTTADLADEASRTARCAALGGTYTKADALQTSAAALAEGQTDPLEEEIGTLKTQGTTLASQAAILTTELNATKTQVAALLAATTPLKLTLAKAKAKTGAKLAVTGQPLKAVKVTLSVKESAARKHKLRSSVLGTKTVTTDATGKAAVTVKLSKAAAKALGSLKGSLAVTAEATSGDRFTTTTGKLTR
jgi:hypothetical protein